MSNVLNKLKSKAGLINAIGAFLYALLFAIVAIGRGTTSGGFMPVFAGIIIMIVGSALIAGVGLFTLLKKQAVAKLLYTVLVCYWILATAQNLLWMGGNAVEEMPGELVVGSIFAFISGLILLSVIALLVLSVLLKKKQMVLFAIFGILGFVTFMLVSGIILLVAYGKYHGSWAEGLSIAADYFVAPIVISIGALYFYGDFVELPEKVKESPKEEAQKNEETK